MIKRSILLIILAACLCVLIAISVALGIGFIHQMFPTSPETAVILIAIFLLLLIVLPFALWIIIKRKLPTPAQTGFYLLLSIGLALVSIYFYWVSSEVFFPADIFIWSESDFVSSLIKISTRYPLYTPQVYNDANVYVPGAPIVSYLIANLIGQPFSIPVYRLIHLFFVLIASGVAVLCTKLLINLGFPEQSQKKDGWWYALWFILLFLFATNLITNLYVHYLHSDALALLLSVAAFLWLILYVSSGQTAYLILMAITPALGFWVKQYLAVWIILYTGYLLLFDFHRSYKRAVLFGLVSSILLILSISVGYLLWKSDFIYWVFTLPSEIDISMLRMIQNLLLVWPYPVIGLLCGWLLFWEKRVYKLFGLWLLWLLLFLQEIATSGVAWMLHHMGPGSLIAGIWLCVTIYIYWPAIVHQPVNSSTLMQWSRIGILIACFILLANGLGFLRIPVDPLGKDATRYVHQIEQEFSGLPTEKVLLDAGSWVYIKDRIVMKDRAVSIGDRGYAGIADFSGILQRIQQKSYDKILMRKYLEPDNWYDNAIWPHSSGINQALQENYQVIRVIKPAESRDYYLFSEISVLVPK